MYQSGKYTYEIAKSYDISKKIRITVNEANESTARSRVINVVNSMPNGPWNTTSIELVAFEEYQNANGYYQATPSSVNVNQNQQLSNIEGKLYSMETNIREMNERGKKAVL